VPAECNSEGAGGRSGEPRKMGVRSRAEPYSLGERASSSVGRTGTGDPALSVSLGPIAAGHKLCSNVTLERGSLQDHLR
jgi:hypothetical protein